MRIAAAGAAAAFALPMTVCSTDPAIRGPKRMAVGQKVEVEVEQGPELVDGAFQLVDGAGHTYGPGDALVEYRFTDSRNISFRIPPGIATGAATVTLGTDGKGYELDLNIVRMAAVLDEDGWIRAVDVDTGATRDAFSLGHGPFSLRLSANGSRILATSGSDHAVHFLHLAASGIEPYAPSVDGIGTKPMDAVFMESGALVATAQGLAVVKVLGSGSTVLDGLLDTGPVNALAGSEEAGRVVALATTRDSTVVQDVLHVVELGGPEPDLDPVPIALGDTAGGSASPVVSSDGKWAFVSNRIDNNIRTVSLDSRQVSVRLDIEPGGDFHNADPYRLGLRPDGRQMVVLCGESETAVFYSVSGGILQYERTVPLGAVGWDVGFESASNAYVLTDGAVVRIDLQDLNAEPDVLPWEASVWGLAIAVQP